MHENSSFILKIDSESDHSHLISAYGSEFQILYLVGFDISPLKFPKMSSLINQGLDEVCDCHLASIALGNLKQ